MDSAQVVRIVEQLKARLEKSNKYELFYDDFSRCHTCSERVACLYQLPELEGLFLVEENFKCKNKKDAEILRAEGNRLFQTGKYAAAMDMYTRSIIKAPDDSENLSLAYNNRSTANFYMKNYLLCLQDIELAFIYNYPPKSCYKLYQRIGRCMYYLYRKDEAIKAFQQTIAAIEKAEIAEDNKIAMIADMKKAIKQCLAIGSPPMNIAFCVYNSCHQDIPSRSTESSNEVPCLADCVEIKFDSYGGRGLFAKQDIEIGEVLIVERPFSSALLKEFNLTHCHFCCKRVLLPVPCRQCSGVIFCSLTCRDDGWKSYHWAECRILENIQDSKGELALLAARMILTAGYDNLVKLNDSPQENTDLLKAGFNENGVYKSDDYRSAYSLVNHANERTNRDLINRTVSAMYYLKYLEFVGFFSEVNEGTCNTPENTSPSLKSPETLLQHKFCVGGHILRNILMLPCNAHEVSEFSLNPSNPAMSATTELAAAIYPALSLINHSCDPSVVRHSFGNVCVGRAIRSISCGEELKDNYGALYPTMDLATRQSSLTSQYFFTCSCEACMEDWPQYFEIPCDRPIFKCSVCHGQVPIPAGIMTEFAKCMSCGQNQDITQTLLQMGEMESAYKQALTSVIDGNNSNQNISILLTYLRFVEKKVHRPWRDINDCQEAYKQCLNIQANCYPV